ncbi:predicted protein [Naegleria gruberi]|uniref:Predicted protein n=1 Tax=Naegleria gruberi TaxID=5762 RepID=D2VVI2_NAEGR|nr:uncharacterized protein NAEGRDRAFT_73028 [Naegleria gruberi]EFC39117.1 predicted protein [Naegleria gruberi]|eukprot:XP_002671861.1 predicted protein [Naegleria gruberi strain NEG-M]
MKAQSASEMNNSLLTTTTTTLTVNNEHVNSYNNNTEYFIGMLEEQFKGCSLQVYFQKESPMVDDNIEGWLEVVKTYCRSLYDINHYASKYSLVSRLLTNYPSKYTKEFETILKFIADENDLTCITQFYDFTFNFTYSAQIFFKCITMKNSEYCKVSKLVPVVLWRKAADELRECVDNFRNVIINNREDLFKYRLKWLIPLTNTRNNLHFDYCVEFGNNLKINTDIYLNVNETSAVYIMFANSNMNDAFNCEEFYKIIMLSILSTRLLRKSVCSFICCKTFAYSFTYDTCGTLTMLKIDLTNVNGMFILFELISYYYTNLACMLSFRGALNKLEEKEKNNFRGIEKSNKTNKLSNKQSSNRLALGDISNKIIK